METEEDRCKECGIYRVLHKVMNHDFIEPENADEEES